MKFLNIFKIFTRTKTRTGVTEQITIPPQKTDMLTLIGGNFIDSEGNVVMSIVEHYQKLADQGDAKAKCQLGDIYIEGRYVPRDYEKAVYWYQKAAKQKYAEASCSLGSLYYHGNGVEQSYEKAAAFFKKAAKQGNPRAMYLLSKCYETGKGIRKDQLKASHWYRKSKERGYRIIELGFKIMDLDKPKLGPINIKISDIDIKRITERLQNKSPQARLRLAGQSIKRRILQILRTAAKHR